MLVVDGKIWLLPGSHVLKIAKAVPHSLTFASMLSLTPNNNAPAKRTSRIFSLPEHHAVHLIHAVDTNFMTTHRDVNFVGSFHANRAF